MAIIGAIVGFLVGIAVAYSLLEKRLNKQKQEHLEQTRQIAEEIERAHQSRIQQTVQSLQVEQDNALRKITVEHENSLREVTTEHENLLIKIIEDRDHQLMGMTPEQQTYSRQFSAEVEGNHDSQLQETIQSLQQQHEAELVRLSDELHNNYQAQIDDNLQALQEKHEACLRETTEEYQNREVELHLNLKSLQEQYEIQLQAVNEQLQAHEAQMQATIKSLQEQYESKLNQTEVLHQQSIQLNPTELPQQQSTELNPTGFTAPAQVIRQAANYSLAELMVSVQSQDAESRKLAASALGKIAAANPLRIDGQRAVETLGKLAQDHAPEVRQTAVEALGMTKSEKVIPLLQRALRDTSSAVAQSASAALNRFKFYRRTPVNAKMIQGKKLKR